MSIKTDFKPGDFVRHRTKGYSGLVSKSSTTRRLRVLYSDHSGIDSFNYDFTEWEKAETCTEEATRILEGYQEVDSESAGVAYHGDVVMTSKAHFNTLIERETVKPGHVQVKVDDLDLSDWANRDENSTAPYGRLGKLIVRTARAAAQTSPDASPTEPKKNSGTEKTTASLPCPECGEAITSEVVVRSDPTDGGRYLGFADTFPVTNHVCKPKQPEEPDYGCVVTVNGAHYIRIKRTESKIKFEWMRVEGARSMPSHLSWDEVCGLGKVTLGWRRK